MPAGPHVSPEAQQPSPQASGRRLGQTRVSRAPPSHVAPPQPGSQQPPSQGFVPEGQVLAHAVPSGLQPRLSGQHSYPQGYGVVVCPWQWSESAVA